MISFPKTRIAASFITMATVLHPHACNAASAASGAATPAQLDHISFIKVGKGSPELCQTNVACEAGG